MKQFLITIIAGIGIATAALFAATGCTSFHAQVLRRDGTVLWNIKKIEADIPLLSRESSIDATLRWLDEETNTMYEANVKQFNASDAQIQADLTKAALAATVAALAAKGGM